MGKAGISDYEQFARQGRDPVPIMREAVDILGAINNLELIWASPRELLNVFQADSIGCHIITATRDILNKLSLVGNDLNLYSQKRLRCFATTQ